MRAFLVCVVVRREPHAPEAQTELPLVEPRLRRLDCFLRSVRDDDAMSLAQSPRPRRALLALAAALACVVPALAGAAPHASANPIPLASDWFGSQNGWEWIADGGSVRATTDGGRTWERIFRGGNYLFAFARTSRNAGVVATGRISGAAFWTSDGGRHWFPLDVVPLRATIAGSGNQLFWHEGGDTIYRVESWPPRGDFPCEEAPYDFGDPLPGHPLCRPVDDGLRSVVAIRLPGTLDRSSALVPVPPARGSSAGVAAIVDDLPHPRGGPGGRGVVVVRAGGLSLARLLPRPAPRPGEETGVDTILAAWPRLYVIAPLFTAPSVPGVAGRPIGSVLRRSRNGGETWSLHTARALPRRAVRVSGPARLGAHVTLPGGWVAAGRTGGRPVVAIRQLGRTRPLVALPGSAKCGALRPVVDWPHVVVEGRSGTQLRAIWLSSDGGYRWTAFGRC